ncbi:MAG: FtsQ-type POTRA domain-containing protein [Myxococcota bacterium]|nr:FtsQ-type POTRA domain-containing protein [Myxococcota bacterium]
MANRYRIRRKFAWADVWASLVDSSILVFRFLRPVVRILLTMTLVAGLGYGAWKTVLNSPYFVIRNVQIESIPQLSDEAVLSTINVGSNSNIFRFDAAQAQVNLLSHPWVAQALVNVELPDRISVALRAREPVAILVMKRMFFVDAEGRPFIETNASEREDYPIITGVSVADFETDETVAQARVRRALGVAAQYRNLPMASAWKLGSIALEFGDRVNLMLGEVRVGLGSDSFGLKLRRLNQIFDSLRERKVGAEYILFGDDPSRVVVKESVLKGADGSSFSLNSKGAEQ